MKKNYILKDIIKYILRALAIIFIIIAVFNINSNSFFGYTARIVLSGSMEPEIRVNSLNVIKTCDAKDISVGDIVCFNYSQDVIHRVIEIKVDDKNNIILHTKGDANERADDIEVYDDMLVGKVVKTFNFLDKYIEKYSLEPGVIDDKLLFRDIVTHIIILCVIIYLVVHAIIVAKIFIKNMHSKNKEYNVQLSKFNTSVDKLKVYRKFISDFGNTNCDTKIKRFGSDIIRALAEIRINILLKEIKSFEKYIEYYTYIKTALEKSENSTITEKN